MKMDKIKRVAASVLGRIHATGWIGVGVLFFAGISSKMDTVKARVLLLSVGAVILVISGVIVLSLPKAW